MRRRFVSLGALLLIGVLVPVAAGAGIFSSLGNARTTHVDNTVNANVQTMTLLTPALNMTPAARGGGDIRVIDDSALLPEEGPAGTIADIEKPNSQTISRYVVREGDTISEIAEMFGVSVNTIRWANDIPTRDTIQPGQALVILPIDGVQHTVEKGDTLASIAKEYRGDADEIARYNGIVEGSALSVGTELTIPNGEVAAAPAYVAPRPSSSPASASPSYVGYYMRPIAGGVRTQGIHGYNGVDIAAPVGTAIMAAATGEVIVSRNSGWNGGYGTYVVIEHGNGTQTLYAHNSSNIVSVGQHVVQGQVIGYVGSSGRSTGAHVHFEIRNGPRNPF